MANHIVESFFKDNRKMAEKYSEKGYRLGKGMLEKICEQTATNRANDKADTKELVLASISLPALQYHKSRNYIEESLQDSGFNYTDIEKLRAGKMQEINDEAKTRLKELEITENMIAIALKKSQKVEEEKPKGAEDVGNVIGTGIKCNPQLEVRNTFRKFLRKRGLSEDLVKSLYTSGLTNELIRLLKGLGFTNEDMRQLQILWNNEKLCTKNPKILRSCGANKSLSQDGFYLKKILSAPLVAALREIVAKQPFDPVEYLGHWLLNYRICEERAKRKCEIELELMVEREKMKWRGAEDKVSVSAEDREGEEYVCDWNYRNYEEPR